MDSPVKTKKRHSKKAKIIIISSVAVILAAGGVAGLLYLKSQNAAKNSTSTVKYESYKVAKGSVEVTVQESGSIAAGTAESVKSDQDIVISGFQVQAGDSVKKGDAIASIDTDALTDSITAMQTTVSGLDTQLASSKPSAGNKYVTSKVEGRVKLLNVKAGDTVQKNMDQYGYLCVISTDGHMKAAFTPDKGKTAAVGDSVTITFADKTTEETIISSKTSDGQYVAIIGEDTYDAGAAADISNSGKVKIGSAKLEVNAPIPVTLSSGTVSSVSVKENSYVYSGSTLLYLTEGQLSESTTSLISERKTAWDSLSAAKELLKTPVIAALQDGVIEAVSDAVGGSIKSGSEIYRIVSDTSFNMTISVDELDISKIEKKQTAVITVDALSDQKINGTVTRISSIGSSSNGVTSYPVTVTLDTATGLMAGMSASCTIAIDKASDVLYVPVGAIQTIANKKYVLVSASSASSGNTAGDAKAMPSGSDMVRPSGAAGGTLPTGFPNIGSVGTGSGTSISAAAAGAQGTLVEVTLGLVNDSYAEIKTGLSEGQIVLVPTFTSTSSTNSMMPGNFSAGGMIGSLTGNDRSGFVPGDRTAATAAK